MSEAKDEKPVDKKPEWKPSIETYSRISNDGKYYIHRTVITDIKPVGYVAAVLRNKNARATTEKTPAKARKSQEASG